MGLTTYAKDKILNHVFRNEEFTSPTAVYVALFTASGEVSGGGYERQAISFGQSDNGVIKNDEEVRFSIATDDWGEIVEAGIFDSSSGGNRLDNSEAVTVNAVFKNNQYIIPAENYTIEVD